MPDSCGTTTRRVMAHNVETCQGVPVTIVVGDDYAEFGPYSFKLDVLRRVLGLNQEVPASTPLFHPTAEERPDDAD